MFSSNFSRPAPCFIPRATAAAEAGDDNILHLEVDDWDRVVEESKNQVIIINLWAPWCESCGGSRDNYKSFASEHRDKPVSFVKFNIGKDLKLAKQLQLKKLPSIRIVKDGELIEEQAKPSRNKKEMDKSMNKLLKTALKL